uniref:Uncharacterized protein n=1 Tax=Arundo donax TaxID=35708 RepID=A0A0A9DUP0_ARUDO
MWPPARGCWAGRGRRTTRLSRAGGTSCSPRTPPARVSRAVARSTARAGRSWSLPTRRRTSW